MKYLSYYGLDKNIFQKEISVKEAYESESYKNMMGRLEYVKEINGIGLFTGDVGVGKTYIVRCFASSLNEETHKIIYISASASKLTTFEFLNVMCQELELEVGNCYKNEVEKKIQNKIKEENKENHKKTILIIDNADNLSSEIITELKFLYDFEMDSIDYISIFLIGNEKIKAELKKSKNESLRQRIIIKYNIENLSRTEVKEYIKTRLLLAGQSVNIFNENALNALYQVSGGNIRKLNNLVITSLMVGYQNELKIIDEERIKIAKEELEI